MLSLRDKLDLDESINNINAKTLKEAVKNSFKSNLYNFNLNSELIDVNDRFRIFRYNDISWIAKKSNKYKANIEKENACKAQQLLEGAIIGGKVVKVLNPIYIEEKGQGYLLTKYISNSLQECLYSNCEFDFTLQDLKELIKLLDKNNMVFRGLLPRNIIVLDNVIYLLDWEDVIFYNCRSEAYLNMQFKTNFLLNWGYFFSHKDLEMIINHANENKIKIEPSINKYEEIFNSFNNNLVDINTLREKIFNIVLFSEKDIQDRTKEFVIKPNDMAHLLSDIYTNEVDVLFDLCTFVLRKNYEDVYVKLLFALSNQIVMNHGENYINKSILIIYILLLLDIDFLRKISNCLNNLDEIIKLIKVNPEIICFDYLNNNFSLFKEKLKNKINVVVREIDPSFKCDDLFSDRLSEYIISLSKERYFLTTVFEDENFKLIQKPDFIKFPRFYVLTSKKDININSNKFVENLSKMQKVIREVYSSYGIKQVGMYIEFNNEKIIVNFIPYYQSVLKKLSINPDNYQPFLEKYLENCNVNNKRICGINKDMYIRIKKRLKKYE